MSRIAWVGVAIGIVVLVAAVGGVAADEHPEHKHPEELEESGDVEAILQWYSDRMGEIHVNCAEGFPTREFDACEDLNERYESLLEPYIDIERENTDTDEEQIADDFNETRQQQAELATLLEEFNETRQEYETARAAGEQTRVRELVWELRRLAERIDELGGELAVRFVTLDTATSADLEQAAVSVNETRDEVITITTTAERDSLEPTELTAIHDSRASIVDPATISGSLRAENGTAIEGGEIVVTDSAGYRETTTTSEDGRYAVSYEPLGTSPGTTEVTVRYIPSDRSVYARTTATTTPIVEAVPARLRIEEISERAAFGDSVRVSGVVSVQGLLIPGVPVEVSVNETTVASGRSGEDGRFELSGVLPATIPTGDTEVTIRGGAADTALEPDRLSETLRIESTPTELSADVTDQATDTAGIGGSLTTANGTAVPNQPVTITLDDETVTTTTSANGVYTASVTQPPAEQNATVSYANSESNLEASETTVTVLPPTDGGTETDNPIDGSPNTSALLSTIAAFVTDNALVTAAITFVTDNTAVATAAGGVALVGIIGVIGALRRRPWESVGEGESTIAAIGAIDALRRRPWDSVGDEDDDPSAITDAGNEENETQEDAVMTEPSEQPTATPESQVLSEAERALETEPDRAAQLAYIAVRVAVEDDIDPAQTHWELYHEVSGNTESSRGDTLRTVVEAFEMATFAPDGIDRTTARNAIAAANEWCAVTDSPSAEQPMASDGGDDDDSPAER